MSSKQREGLWVQRTGQQNKYTCSGGWHRGKEVFTEGAPFSSWCCWRPKAALSPATSTWLASATLCVDTVTATFSACPKMRAALVGHEDALAQRLRRNVGDAHGFVVELTDLLERLAQAHSRPAAALPSVAFYELIVRELDAIGWGMLVSISPSLDDLQLLVEDAAGRGHVLGLSIPPDYPQSPPKASVSLPAPFELRWSTLTFASAAAGAKQRSTAAASAATAAAQHQYSLSTALSQFRLALSRHQLLWDMLDDLDRHAWVLEPKNPTRDCVSRRIALGDHASLQIELHVASPASLPELQFLGADRVIAPLRHALNANLGRWSNTERTVRLNLQTVLERDFPAPPSATEPGAEADDSYAVECAICYMYELEGGARVRMRRMRKTFPQVVPQRVATGASHHAAIVQSALRRMPVLQPRHHVRRISSRAEVANICSIFINTRINHAVCWVLGTSSVNLGVTASYL